MKTYIKPQTNVQNVVINSAIMEGSVTETFTIQSEDVVNTNAKERDVWSDVFWN